jgi:hypothetical protein
VACEILVCAAQYQSCLLAVIETLICTPYKVSKEVGNYTTEYDRIYLDAVAHSYSAGDVQPSALAHASTSPDQTLPFLLSKVGHSAPCCLSHCAAASSW